ncbi:MAG: hypothetical protein ACRDJE_04690 [Dehalococcoidia bacterium]
MSRRNGITKRDVQDARRAVARTERRIRTHGEGVVAQAAWDEAVEQALESPDVEAVRAALAEPAATKRRGRDRRREAAHQDVVRFVQDRQRAG